MIEVNMKLRDMQNLELEILKYFDKVCRENNLIYFLAYGTLIGAIRHSGFIPWDDDIDVMMPREDYLKLVSIMGDNPHSFYKLVSYETNKRFTAPLPKIIDTRTELIQHYDYKEAVVLGVYIDIFILDGAGQTMDDATKWYDDSFVYYRNWRRSDLALFPPNKSKIYGVLRYLKNIKYKTRGIAFYLEELKKHNSQKSFYACDYVSTLEVGTLPSSKCIWPKGHFFPIREHVFEGVPFYIPNKYDEVLKSEYGNYMKLPPIEEQKPHHVYTLKINDEIAELFDISHT